MRGVAVLLVVSIHAMSVPDRMGAEVLVPYLWSVGPAGVDLFFVISGFIITTVALHAASGPGTNFEIARDFAIKRLVRIYPLFWIAMLVFWLAYPHVNIAAPGFLINPMWQLLLLIDLLNYLLIAAWSLSFEVYFYLVMTVILMLWPRHIYRSLVIWGIISAILVVVGGLTSDWLLFQPITSPLLFEFMLGVLVAYLIQKNETRFAFGALVLSICLFVIGGEVNRAYWNWEQPVYRFICFGPASALIIYGVLALELRNLITFPKVVQRMGDASYCMYIWHQPLFFAIAKCFTFTGLRAFLPTWTLFPIAIAFVIVWGLLSYHLLERPMQKFLLKRLLGGKRLDPRLVMWPALVVAACLIAYVPARFIVSNNVPSPGVTPALTVELKGEPDIKETTLIEIRPQNDHVQLNLSVEGEGDGKMYFGYKSAGKHVEQWRDFKRGENILSIVVPPALDDGGVWIAREKPYTDMKVTGVSVVVCEDLSTC